MTSAPVPGDRLGDVLQQLQDGAAPFLALLHPAIRDSLQGIGRGSGAPPGGPRQCSGMAPSGERRAE